MRTLHKALVVALATLCLIQLVLLPLPVLADNSLIPKGLLSWHDELLKNRDHILEMKAEASTQIQDNKTIILEVESKLPVLSDEDKAWGKDVIHGCMERIDRWNGYIADLEIEMIKNEKVLADMEAQMREYACLK
jgi:hypothetical protein